MWWVSPLYVTNDWPWDPGGPSQNVTGVQWEGFLPRHRHHDDNVFFLSIDSNCFMYCNEFNELSRYDRRNPGRRQDEKEDCEVASYLRARKKGAKHNHAIELSC